uniref:LIM zinc-binding domain-containing protein n=1 Tax=Laticauda laticaudata TaxID=8630 RepID=A0A8C5RGQ3_LATLA
HSRLKECPGSSLTSFAGCGGSSFQRGRDKSIFFPFILNLTVPVLSLSLDTEPTMNHLEGDSEVYKLMQENRDTRAAPRQSSTFRLLQVGTASHFPSQLSPSLHKPVSSTTAGNAQKLHTCEKCDSPITYQAVKIQENRYRHPSCYVCTDCGLNLKMRGHFWVGEEMYCEKHARQRYQSPAEDGTVLAVYSQS